MAQNDRFDRESPAGDRLFLQTRQQLIQELSISQVQIALAQDTALLAVAVAAALGWNSGEADALALDAFRLAVGAPLVGSARGTILLSACFRRCEEPYGRRWDDERIAAELPSRELQAAFRQVQLVWQPVGTA
jgi:malonyl CoA-acyl carrier protein transacylase